MAIYIDQVGRRVTGEPFAWGPDDTSLYALSVGVSNDGAAGLKYTAADASDDTSVLPTFAAILTMKSASSPIKHVGDFHLSKIIHAGQEVSLTKPLPTSGTAVGTTEVTGIFDTGKHAIIETTTFLTTAGADPASSLQQGEEFAQTKSTILVLGEGGFGGGKPPQSMPTPNEPAHGTTTFQTSPNQALLYRLNGDRNPLHFDSDVATAVGFERPILHGLCTFGIASQLLLRDHCADDPKCFESFGARFVKPVYPGATLEISWWQVGTTIHFDTRADGDLVLDSGHFTIRK